MKVHMFHYRMPGFEDSPPIPYAYTTDKHIAEEFEKQRSKKRMIHTVKEMNKEEFKKFKFCSRKYLLDYRGYYSKSSEYGKRVQSSILSTVNEENKVMKDIDNFWVGNDNILFDIKMFESKYIQALEALGFVDFYLFYKVKFSVYREEFSFYAPYYNSYGPPEGFIIDDFKHRYLFDEVNLFTRFFKDTFDD